MVEIVQRKGHVCGHAFEQRDDPFAERADLLPGDQEHADGAAVAGQRQRSHCAHASLVRALAPGQRPGIVEKIVADAGLAVAKGLATNAVALGGIGDDRNIDAAQPRDVLAAAGRKSEQAGLAIQQEDSRRQEAPAGKCGFADLAV